MAFGKVLLSLFQQARELNIARKLTQGLGLDSIGQALSQAFPGLPRADLQTILDFGQKSFEAGRVIGRLEAGALVPIAEIPTNVHLPPDFLEGGRGVIDLHIQFANDPVGRDIQVIFSGDETMQELINSIEQRSAELFERYEAYRTATIDDVRVELLDPGVLQAIAFHGATRGF